MELLSEFDELFYEEPETRYYFLTGGRGSAKSYHASTLLLNLTYQPGHIILFTRWTMVSAHISIIPEFLEKIELLNAEADFEVTRHEIINKHSGSKILFRGIKTSQKTAKANLKSIQGVTTWCIDEAEEVYDEKEVDTVDLSIRQVGIANRVIFIMNPSFKTHFLYKKFIETPRADTTYIHTTYLHNAHNLSKSFLDIVDQHKRTNYQKYCHLFLGHWLESSEGLLWNMDLIDKFRVTEAPILKRVIVAVDPAITAKAGSDETGIIVVGLSIDNRGYVLEDGSGTYSPNEWATKAVQLYKKWNAKEIVAEVNQGGDMVENTIKVVDPLIHVHKVHATKGKFVRAEPVYALYQMGRVSHFGYFGKLESQMVTWNPDDNHASPDRMDALVWGLSRLMLVDNTSSRANGKGRRHKSNSL